MYSLLFLTFHSFVFNLPSFFAHACNVWPRCCWELLQHWLQAWYLLIHNTQLHVCTAPLPSTCIVCTVLTVRINNVAIALFWAFTKDDVIFLSLHYTELGLGGWAVPVKLRRTTTKCAKTNLHHLPTPSLCITACYVRKQNQNGMTQDKIDPGLVSFHLLLVT